MSTVFTKHQPPNNLQAEKEFLGACLFTPEIVKKSAMLGEYFYSEKHRAALEEMQRQYRTEGDFTALTLVEKLEGFSVTFFSELMAEAEVDALWSSNRKLIIESWRKRRLYDTAQGIIQSIVEKRDSDEIAADVLNQVRAVQSGVNIGIKKYSDVVNTAFKAIEERSQRGGLSGVPSGITLLDDMMDGFQDEEFYLVAARPGVGKSAFCQGVLHHAAANKYPCGLINLEMSDKQLGIRAIASRSNIPITLVKKGMLDDHGWLRVTNAIEHLWDLPIYVCDSAFSDLKIGQAMYKLVHNFGCKLIVLDYIQLMKAEGTQQLKNREREVAGFSRLMKEMAKELRIPVIGLAQINRASEAQRDKRPGIHNLRESGALEADADAIILLHQPECNCQADCSCGNRNTLELIIGKGRNIGTGTIMAEWNPKTTTFGRSYRPGEALPVEERKRYAD